MPDPKRYVRVTTATEDSNQRKVYLTVDDVEYVIRPSERDGGLVITCNDGSVLLELHSSNRFVIHPQP